jgi:hypothetical protein
MGYVAYNVKKKEASRGRQRAAVAAIHIAAYQFSAAGMMPPAGICPPGKRAECLQKTAAWLPTLAALDPAEAMQLLADNLHMVSSKLVGDVEREYNVAVRATRNDELPELAHGELASRLALHATAMNNKDALPTVLPFIAGPAVPRGRFYYICAGIGSGICHMQQVSVFLSATCISCLRIALDSQVARN